MNPQIFAGRDSARTFYAERTNQRSGPAFEVWSPSLSRRIGRILLEASVLIAFVIAVLSLLARVLG